MELESSLPRVCMRMMSDHFSPAADVLSLLVCVDLQDSWGGRDSLSPLPKEEKMTASTSNPSVPFVDEDEDLSDPDEKSEDKQNRGEPNAEAPPQSTVEDALSKPAPAVGDSESIGTDIEEVASYINFDKYLTKNSANYYYSQKNKNVREKLDKVKASRQSSTDFDNSMHGKVSILLERKQSSSYKGPQRLRSDGSLLKPAIKSRRGSTFSANTSFDGSSSIHSAPLKRTISFASVHIREHERIAGDNPCVTSGVPLSIGWGSVEHNAIDLDLYENSKGPARDKIEMMVPAAIRKSMLRDEFGVSVKELNESIKAVNITKRNRRHTVAGEGMEGWGEGVESVKRKLGRFIRKTTKEKEEKKLWEQAHRAALKK